MADTKTVTATSAAAIVALTTGLAVGRLSSQPSVEAHPVQMRWLNEGPGKPNRYALGIVGTIEGAQLVVEIVCEADGSQPKLNGRPFDAGKKICETAAREGGALNQMVGELARELSKPR